MEKTEPFERVSGHRVPPSRSIRAADLPEHDWKVAQALVFPLLQPVGTRGVPVDRVPRARDAAGHQDAEPLVASGPCGLAICYAIQAERFDVLVNGEHLAAWGITSKALEQTAQGNLAAWSKDTPWTDESSGERRLLSSDSGQGYDASRILLPEVREYLRSELAGEGSTPGTRVLVGLPDRHLLVSGALAPDDVEFLALFREFVIEQAEAAEERVDRRVLEVADGKLVEFAE